MSLKLVARTLLLTGLICGISAFGLSRPSLADEDAKSGGAAQSQSSTPASEVSGSAPEDKKSAPTDSEAAGNKPKKKKKQKKEKPAKSSDRKQDSGVNHQGAVDQIKDLRMRHLW